MIITSDDILGKEAVDPEGSVLGIIMKLHIDKEQKEVIGITIDQGFMKPDLFVGISFIKNFGVDSVFLSKIPSDTIKGLEVMESNGKSVGVVRDVVFKRNHIEKLIVSKRGLMKKPIEINYSHIKEIGSRVILKKHIN